MSFIFLVVGTLFLSAILLAVFLFVAKCNALKELKKLPGPKPSLLFGNVLQLQGEADDIFVRFDGWMHDSCKEGIICVWIGPVSPLLLIYKPELAEANSKEDVFNIMPYIARCTLDVICVTAMGSSPNAQEKSSSPYVQSVIRISELFEERYRTPWLWPYSVFNLTSSGREMKKCVETVHGFTDKVIDDRIAERAATKTSNKEQGNEGQGRRKKRLAFLDLLLEAYDNEEISREGVREEVDTFTFEGHDTTAAAITWTLYLLGRHPEFQQKVYEEVETFFDTRPDTLTVEDLKEFRYMECVLKEAQRMFPHVPFYSRMTSEDDHFGCYFVPKGTTVGISTFELHRNPEVWPAPLEFNPDRFLPENSEGRHPYAFVPFSAGSRNCIGQRLALLEEKLVLANILHRFRVKSAQTFKELCLCSQLILRPKEGIFVTLTKRL